MPDAPYTPPVREADDPEYAANLRRATLASTVGSALEYYDFALYGLASALIFSKLFFSNLDPGTALVASFATFGVGFVARPLGGLFFGTIGDRLGRKWVLVVTILLMGGSSTLVGALPTYDTGFWSLYEHSGTWLRMVASPFYHALHIVQLRVLHRLTGDAVFSETADRWEAYGKSFFNRKRAWIQKALFKVCYY